MSSVGSPNPAPDACPHIDRSRLTVPIHAADCECGYSVNSTKDSDHAIFTDILESDFTTLKKISVDTDWVLQEWSVEQKASRGPYGRKTMARNAVSNPASNLKVSDDGILGGQAGLRLYVRKLNPDDQYVSIVEADTFRTDMMYGSFRAGIKTTNINGTCGAFFWYTQAILAPQDIWTNKLQVLE